MKIALCQLNYTIGDFAANSKKIIDNIEKAKHSHCDLVVFSELAICGYPPLDFLENKDFIHTALRAIESIANHCQGITAIVGGVEINPNKKGKKLYNTAFVLADGKIQQSVYKTLLPTYDIFDEYRYFEPNTFFDTVRIAGVDVALTICEDLWDKQPVENSFSQSKLYTVSPLAEIKSKFDIIINIAASPFSLQQENARKSVLIDNAKQYHVPVVYVNQVSANTELIFDGQSMVINPKGEMVLEMSEFSEDFSIFDTNQSINSDLPVHQLDQAGKLYQAIQLGLSDYFRKMGFTKAVIGLSGGIDSAVVAALAVDALGADNVVGILMPSKFSSDHSISDAEQLAANLGIKTHLLPIADSVEAVENTLEPVFRGTAFGIAEENIQARIRGVFLMAYANKFGHILLNTSNKSEAAVGYSTLYGDMNGGLSILGDVYKTQVYLLAEYINRNGERIPINSITKAPSAELRPGQKDADSLPDYDTLDAILKLYIEKKYSRDEIIAAGYEAETVKKTVLMVNRNEYKRFQSPPILRLSPKAFGLGRRMPLVAQYDF